MATWNNAFEASPAGSDVPSAGDDKIRELKEAVRERLDKEHVMDLTSGLVSEDGWHEEGSAKAYIQASAPTTRPDGSTALSSDDNGRIWIGSVNNTVYVYDHSAGATTADRWVERGVISGNSLKGYESVTLTAHDTASVPSVASGSVLEVNGTYYALTSGASISGSAASGLNYIKFSASGDTLAAEWAQSAASWSDSKQGWYVSNDRYLFSCYYDGSSAYSNKVKLVPEQSPFDFFKPAFISRYTEDLTLSSNTTQRVIYARNLTIDTSITLKARTIICEGNFTIENGVTVTLEEISPTRTFAENARNYDRVVPFGGAGSETTQTQLSCGYGGATCSTIQDSAAYGGGGGFGEGGDGGYPDSDYGLSCGGKSNGIDIADGGYGGGDSQFAAGGGATTANGGHRRNTDAIGGYGAPVTIIICKGNFINNGTIISNGGSASAGTTSGGGGGAGVVGIFAYGDTYTGGTITAEGGDGKADGGTGGGGGAGGGIVIYAKTSSFGTLSVAGGTGNGGNATDGGTGVTETVDIRVNPSEILGGEASVDDSLGATIFRFAEGLLCG